MKRLLVGAVALAGAVALGAAPAGAEISGSCTATMKGLDVGSRSSTSKGDAIKVDADETLTVSATSTAAIESYDVQLEFAGFKWNVASGEANGNTWSRDVDVNDYARFGVGLYKVYGVSNGPSPCTGAVLVQVGGRNPLTTVLGAFGAVLGAGAAVGAISSLQRSGTSKRILRGADRVARDAFDTADRGLRVDPQRFADDLYASPSPATYVRSIEGLADAGGGWDEMVITCFKGPELPRDIVAFVCRWG